MSSTLDPGQALDDELRCCWAYNNSTKHTSTLRSVRWPQQRVGAPNTEHMDLVMVDTSPPETPPSSPELMGLPGHLGDAFTWALAEEINAQGDGSSGSVKRTHMPACAGDAPGTPPPPDSLHGEAFVTRFLREYEEAGRLLTSTRVTGLASGPGRKSVLACELPAGWYVIDDAPAPEQVLPQFDTSLLPACGWKVTGPQVKVFNPDVPIQIRYGNPKDGCTKGYNAMRAAVYTWCQQDATGTVVEGSVKLVHVYLGRASRSLKRRHPSTGNNTRNPSVRPRRVANPPITEQLVETASGSSVGHVATRGGVLGKILYTLKQSSMLEAASVVQGVIAEHLIDVRKHAPHGSYAPSSSPSHMLASLGQQCANRMYGCLA